MAQFAVVVRHGQHDETRALNITGVLASRTLMKAPTEIESSRRPCVDER